MKVISLTKGLVTIVDDEDYEGLIHRTWYAQFNGITHYAATSERDANGRNRIVLMHRLILSVPPGQFVDHRDRNTLDNRRQNLRYCTKAQNAQNSKIRSDNTTGKKGVSFRKEYGTYRATIRISGRGVHLGTYDTAEGAAKAYDDAARLHFGEFALPNAS